jgi:hypothetical protein
METSFISGNEYTAEEWRIAAAIGMVEGYGNQPTNMVQSKISLIR